MAQRVARDGSVQRSGIGSCGTQRSNLTSDNESNAHQQSEALVVSVSYDVDAHLRANVLPDAVSVSSMLGATVQIIA